MRIQRLATLGLLTSLLCGCPVSGRPNTTRPPRSAVEQAPTPRLPAAFTRVGNRVSKATLDRIVGGWFERPYKPMFASYAQQLRVEGSAYGRFNAGVNGILLYGGLASAIANVKGWRVGGFYDLKPIAKLAGLALYKKKAKDLASFSYYNPVIVRWGVQNLLPDPERRLGAHRYRQIYQTVFSRVFRLFAEARLYLRQGGRERQEARAYLAAMAKPGFDGLDYLQKRYAGALGAYALSHNSCNLTPQMAIGFWIRRRIGGSADQLWRALSILLERYDPPWFAALKKRRGSRR